jgi:Dihaem cytochrome c
MKHLLHALAAMALLTSTWAMADDDDVLATPRTPLLAEYQQECASCHLAYPPALLPAASWRRLMDNLPTHFGTDASLAPDQVKRLSQWLQQAANAANARRRSEPPPQDRITRSRWFLHEHDELPASVWQRPSIQRPSNCMACHTKADQGDFRERHIRIPR